MEESFFHEGDASYIHNRLPHIADESLFFFGVLSFNVLIACFRLDWTRGPLYGNANLTCIYTAA